MFNMLVADDAHAAAPLANGFSVAVPYVDLKQVIRTVMGMQLERLSMFVVQNYVPPCNAITKEATDVCPAELCGGACTWALAVDGSFVCDAHRPEDDSQVHRVTEAHAMSGIILLAENKVDVGVRAHLPGEVVGTLDEFSAFELIVQGLSDTMDRAFNHASDRCTHIRVCVDTTDGESMPRISFQPNRMKARSKQVGSISADSEKLQFFPAPQDLPLQLTAISAVTLMLQVPLLQGFKKLFTSSTAKGIVLDIAQLCPVGGSAGVITADTELMGFTLRAGMDATACAAKVQRHFFSTTRIVKSAAEAGDISAVRGSVGFATDRVQRMDIPRNTIGRLLQQKNGKLFEARHLVHSKFELAHVVNAFNIALKDLAASRVYLMTAEQCPIAMVHKLPSGGILMVQLLPMFDLETDAL